MRGLLPSHSRLAVYTFNFPLYDLIGVYGSVVLIIESSLVGRLSLESMV